MINKLRKKQIINIILNLKHKEEKSFKEFSPEEKLFIIDKIKNQNGSRGFEMECNNAITKFRKRILL